MHPDARLIGSFDIDGCHVEAWGSAVWGHRGVRKWCALALAYWRDNGRQDRMVSHKAVPGYVLIFE